MFDFREIANIHAVFDISNEEAERISKVVNSYDEFVQVWENEDWWKDSNYV